MHSIFTAAALSLILVIFGLDNVRSQLDPDCVCVQEVEAARNFSNPLIIIHSGDGTDRLFVGEQTGQLWVLLRNENEPGGWELLQEPFLNISVYFENFPGNEQGFLATRFHPEYATNGLLYVWYTIYSDPTFTRLSEFRVDPGNPNMADPEYERPILEIEQIASNHNGGDLVFLADGTLLIFVGDGGIAGDPLDQALDKTSLLGKVLRIDINNQDEGLEYAIPPDNPFLNDTEARRELYAIGMRNPWRAFADPKDGRIFIGDVGQNWMEEVDVLAPGQNFGWSAFEGTTCYKPDLCPIYEDVYIKPIYEYSLYAEGENGQSIIQGPMYRGCENPGLEDWLIFGDYWVGDIYRLLDQGDAPEWTGEKDVLMCEASVCEAAGLSNEYVTWINTFGEDERREVYFGSSPFRGNPGNPRGRVYKIVDPANRGTPCEIPSRH